MSGGRKKHVAGCWFRPRTVTYAKEKRRGALPQKAKGALTTRCAVADDHEERDGGSGSRPGECFERRVAAHHYAALTRRSDFLMHRLRSTCTKSPLAVAWLVRLSLARQK